MIIIRKAFLHNLIATVAGGANEIASKLPLVVGRHHPHLQTVSSPVLGHIAAPPVTSVHANPGSMHADNSHANSQTELFSSSKISKVSSRIPAEQLLTEEFISDT